MTQKPTSVFVSYCRADSAWLQRLKVHLRPLVRDGELDFWDDSKISPGQDWKREIATALTSAHVAVLLVSADFLASDFVSSSELPPILRGAEDGGVLVLPVIVEPCLFDAHQPLSRFQALNPPERPLSAMPRHEAEQQLATLAGTIRAHIRKRSKPTEATSASRDSPSAPQQRERRSPVVSSQKGTALPAAPERTAVVTPDEAHGTRSLGAIVQPGNLTTALSATGETRTSGNTPAEAKEPNGQANSRPSFISEPPILPTHLSQNPPQESDSNSDHLETEGAPQWLIIMMIAAATAFVIIVGYIYLIK